MQKSSIVFGLLTLIAILFTPLAAPGLAQDFPDVCQEPENILPNCTFDAGLSGWQTFTEAGSASFSVLQGGGECHAPLCPAAYIVVEDHFVGGLYQQVQVTPGANYYANIVWLVFDSLANDAGINSLVGGIGRRIGVDPTGGTDPTSSNVVWSTDNWRNDCKICNIEHVTVTAQANTITVFLRLDDTWKLKAAEKGYPVPPSKDQFWIDDIGLKPVGGDPIPLEAPPTDTPEPPPATDTPVPQPPTAVPATNTPEPEPQTESAEETAATNDTGATEIAAATEETPPASEPVSPVATPTAVPVNTQPAAPPTLTPTHTPPPTDTPRPRPSPTRTPTRSALPESEAADLSFTIGAVGTAACFGGLILVILAAVLAGLVWLYRMGWVNSDDDDDSDAESSANPPPPAIGPDAPDDPAPAQNGGGETD